MQVWNAVRRLAVAMISVVALGLPASADIKSFNTAMLARDYKTAAAEAASTWPTLDKSREDIAIIAREFGFAAYVAGDFAAARTYGEAALAGSQRVGEDPTLLSASEVLMRLAEHRLAPSGKTRDNLYAALKMRSADPSIDLITYLAADATATYDFDRGAWEAARSSAALGEEVTRHGEGYYSASNFRFALVAAAARYMDDKNMAAYDAILALERRLVQAIAEAPTDEAAKELGPVHLEVSTWGRTMRSHLEGLRRFRATNEREEAAKAYFESTNYLRAMSRIKPELPEGVCKATLARNSPIPDYPRSALFRGMVGTIVLELDLDDAGRVSNSEILLAVPLKHFGDALSKGADRFRFQKAEGSPPGCTLAQKGYVFTVIFSIAG